MLSARNKYQRQTSLFYVLLAHGYLEYMLDEQSALR